MMDRAFGILSARLRAFAGARNGNVAMMFAIALVPISIAAGAGLDLARGMTARSNMSEALDAAALAVGSTPNITQDQAQQLAQKYFDANYHGAEFEIDTGKCISGPCRGDYLQAVKSVIRDGVVFVPGDV